jgi:hypothetical protein
MDDQHLFELNVKLQYAEDNDALVAALHELAGAAVLDFPPETFLQRAALLDSVLEVVLGGTGSAGAAPEQARRLAFAFLQSLVARLKQALIDAGDAELHPNYVGAQQALCRACMQ